MTLFLLYLYSMPLNPNCPHDVPGRIKHYVRTAVVLWSEIEGAFKIMIQVLRQDGMYVSFESGILNTSAERAVNFFLKWRCRTPRCGRGGSERVEVIASPLF